MASDEHGTSDGNYPVTPHPEDQPGYGYSSYQGYPASYGVNHGGPLHTPREKGTGRVDVLRAVSWGLKTAFANWTVWILGVLAFFLVVILVSVVASIAMLAGSGDPATAAPKPMMTLVSGAAGFFVSALAYNAATRQLDRPKITWGDFVRGINAGPLTAILVIQALLGLVLTAGAEMLVTGSVKSLTGETAGLTFDELGPILLSQAGAGLVALLFSPLLVFIPYFIADRKAGIMDAITRGIHAGLRNYGRLIALQAVLVLTSVALIMVTLGLGALVVMPVTVLIYAHLYRQAAGFELPAELR